MRKEGSFTALIREQGPEALRARLEEMAEEVRRTGAPVEVRREPLSYQTQPCVEVVPDPDQS